MLSPYPAELEPYFREDFAYRSFSSLRPTVLGWDLFDGEAAP